MERVDAMKIGEFARRNRVGIDTVRHYMEMGLLFPPKEGGQYEFDELCQSDMDAVLNLKKLGFSLASIKSINLIRRLGEMTKIERDDYYQTIFESRLREVESQLKSLRRERALLKTEIGRLSAENAPSARPMGIPHGLLPLLRCRKCGEAPELLRTEETGNPIRDGELRCSCGSLTVRDGILYAEPVKEISSDFAGIGDYVRETDDGYLEQLYRTLEWKKRNLRVADFEGRVALELGCGAGIFLRSIYRELPENSLYIAVDHDVGFLKALKRDLERAGMRKNVVFLCCDFTRIPLKNDSVDLVCDMTGSSNYGFEHEEFLPALLDPLFRKDAAFFGTFLTFKNFRADSLIGPAFRKNFELSHIRGQLAGLGFQTSAEYVSKPIEKGGVYESFFKSGEKIVMYSCLAKRPG